MSLFKARLRGSNEVPSVETEAHGFAFFLFKRWNNHLKLKFFVKVKNIQNVTKIDLHLGQRGQNGPVIATLFEATGTGISVDRGIVKGVLKKGDLEGPLSGLSLRFLLREIKNNNVYVNVHTTEHPNGEIRGQIKKFKRPHS